MTKLNKHFHFFDELDLSQLAVGSGVPFITKLMRQTQFLIVLFTTNIAFTFS